MTLSADVRSLFSDLFTFYFLYTIFVSGFLQKHRFFKIIFANRYPAQKDSPDLRSGLSFFPYFYRF